MIGTIAVTDYGWYEKLFSQGESEEVNFWKPSSRRTFRADEFSPFLFKLRSPHNAICGFAYFARYSRLPDWLAWNCFGRRNGCSDLSEMRERIQEIRERIRYKSQSSNLMIGCIILLQPVFFPRHLWTTQPEDWPVRTQAFKKYDLAIGEGRRVWDQCRERAHLLHASLSPQSADTVAEPAARYGEPQFVRPRLGQGAFKVAVTEAYRWGCAFTGEHSLPALDAAHIKPYAKDGPHEVPNGLLLRADLHRLFDGGYITLTPKMKIEVSRRLREDYQNGRSYYPLHGQDLQQPARAADLPGIEFLKWHNENRFLS